MKWNEWIRQVHRWLAIAFTVLVITVTIAVSGEEPAAWVYYMPLLPLALLLVTGLYLFVLPYATRWRGGRSDGPTGGRQHGGADAGRHSHHSHIGTSSPAQTDRRD